MSGGLDSTTVAALAVNVAQKYNRPLDLRSYTVDCQPDLADDEGRLAALTAQRLRISNEIQCGTACLPYEGWKAAGFPMPEPLHDPYRLLYLQQTRRIAKHSRVALNGYGGDGIMSGGSWPYFVDLLRNGQIGTLIHTFGKYVLRHGRLPPLRGGFRQKLRRLQRRHNLMRDYPQWFAPEFERELGLRERWVKQQEKLQTSHSWYPEAHAAISVGFWASVLENEDSGWTGDIVQSRAPLLDIRIARFLLRIPPVPLCVDKELLRRAGRHLIPREVTLRSKKPFRGDLLAFQIESRRWDINAISDVWHRELAAIVKKKEFWSSLERAAGSNRWRDLRPVSLGYWLDRIEIT